MNYFKILSISIIVNLSNFNFLFSQNCSCTENLNFVYKTIEENYVVSKEQIKGNEKSYTALKDKILKQSLNTNGLDCYFLINEYLLWFKDLHVGVSFNFDSIPFERIASVLKTKRTNPFNINNGDFDTTANTNSSIEGIWESPKDQLTINITKLKGSKNKFIGVVVESKSLFWSPGHIKFIFEKKDSIFHVLNHTDDAKIYYTYLNPGKSPIVLNLFNTWYKLGKDKKVLFSKKPEFPLQNADTTVFKQLTRQHVYLKLPSFDFYQKSIIDSIVGKNFLNLTEANYLIIDVRDNFGGTITCYDTLKPIFISKSFTWDSSLVLSTKKNIEFYENLTALDNVSSKLKEEVKSVIFRMNSNLGKKIILDSAYQLKKGLYSSPKRKIIILVNEKTASSAEYLLLQAKHNKNTIIVGNYSMGVVDNGNVHTTDIPCGKFQLSWPTSTSTRVNKFDGIGIKPNILLKSDNMDWVNFVIANIK